MKSNNISSVFSDIKYILFGNSLKQDKNELLNKINKIKENEKNDIKSKKRKNKSILNKEYFKK